METGSGENKKKKCQELKWEESYSRIKFKMESHQNCQLYENIKGYKFNEKEKIGRIVSSESKNQCKVRNRSFNLSLK